MVNTCVTNISPIDAKIYYEDGKPYMEYKGTTFNWHNDKVEVYFPKISSSKFSLTVLYVIT